MGCALHDTHGHSHGGSAKHSHNDNENQQVDSGSTGGVSDGGGKHHQENINVRAAFIHVVSDFIQSLGVFIASLVIYFKPEWNLIDPICTFFFSILVLVTTIAIMKDALLVGGNHFHCLASFFSLFLGVNNRK